MFINECLTRLRLLQVHRIGFSYLWDKGFLQFYPMVKRSPRRELPSLWFVEDFGVFSILGRKFLFHSFSSLGQSHRECELSDVRMVLPKHSAKGCCIPLLGVDSGSKLVVVFFHGMEVSQEVPLFEYLRVIMPWDRGSSHPDCSSCPVDEGIRFG